jgi:hypothetical protein
MYTMRPYILTKMLKRKNVTLLDFALVKNTREKRSIRGYIRYGKQAPLPELFQFRHLLKCIL